MPRAIHFIVAFAVLSLAIPALSLAQDDPQMLQLSDYEMSWSTLDTHDDATLQIGGLVNLKTMHFTDGEEPFFNPIEERLEKDKVYSFQIEYTPNQLKSDQEELQMARELGDAKEFARIQEKIQFGEYDYRVERGHFNVDAEGRLQRYEERAAIEKASRQFRDDLKANPRPVESDEEPGSNGDY